ncbi:hypothetical protein STEG23_018074, partial [Scotinomys teguina]
RDILAASSASTKLTHQMLLPSTSCSVYTISIPLNIVEQQHCLLSLCTFRILSMSHIPVS